MREKHFTFSICIFTFMTALLSGLFMLTCTQVFAGNRYKGNDRRMEQQKDPDKAHQKHRAEMKRESGKHGKEMNRENLMHRGDQNRESGNRAEMRRENGYREHPYDKNRHYVKYEHNGHRYDYNGHWRSWEEWDRYAKKHPDIYKYGRYYRENAHLMFRFCAPETDTCFFFSIGR